VWLTALQIPYKVRVNIIIMFVSDISILNSAKWALIRVALFFFIWIFTKLQTLPPITVEILFTIRVEGRQRPMLGPNIVIETCAISFFSVFVPMNIIK